MSFTALPLGANLAVFAATAIVVWFAGVRIARWADALATATGLASAVIGLVLLGGITSLPEVAVTVTAAVRGDAPLAANNLLGGLALQVAILAVADAVIGRDALSSVNAKPVVMLQASLDAVMLVLVALAIAIGEFALPFGVGAWALGIGVTYGVSVALVGRFRGSGSWVPAQRPSHPALGPGSSPEERPAGGTSVRGLVTRIAAAGAVVLAAGALSTISAEAIATQTGLGTSFVGAVLLAGATSLPELSTAIEAVRLRRYTMAFGDIFGTNLIDVALILLIDAVAAGPPVLGELGAFSQVAALLGVLLTMIYVVGLIERRDRVVLRMGIDSALVVLLYLGGLVLLYRLR